MKTWEAENVKEVFSAPKAAPISADVNRANTRRKRAATAVIHAPRATTAGVMEITHMVNGPMSHDLNHFVNFETT